MPKEGELLPSIHLSELPFMDEHLKPCWKCQSSTARLQLEKAEIALTRVPKFFVVCGACGELAREQAE